MVVQIIKSMLIGQRLQRSHELNLTFEMHIWTVSLWSSIPLRMTQFRYELNKPNFIIWFYLNPFPVSSLVNLTVLIFLFVYTVAFIITTRSGNGCKLLKETMQQNSTIVNLN